jgi:hypothetical protein
MRGWFEIPWRGENPRLAGKAAEGIRTLDLLHGKDIPAPDDVLGNGLRMRNVDNRLNDPTGRSRWIRPDTGQKRTFGPFAALLRLGRL